MLSAETLVSFGRHPYTGWTGRLNQKDYKAIEEAIEITGIQKLRKNFVSRLSDGEKQKVMIARAVAQQTPIMILDEPTAFLDLPNKVMIMRLLKNLAKEFSKTILISTHDLELALQTADKAWLISSDKKFYQGTPDELAANGSIHKTFPQVEFDKTSGKFIFFV
jgi:iron complex transport system ATP-binding protein